MSSLVSSVSFWMIGSSLVILHSAFITWWSFTVFVTMASVLVVGLFLCDVYGVVSAAVFATFDRVVEVASVVLFLLYGCGPLL